jgi:hypothetical protein
MRLAPYQLLFGRGALKPINRAFENPPEPPQKDLDYHRYAEQLRNRSTRHKRTHGKRPHLPLQDYVGTTARTQKEIKVGKQVWLFTPVTKPDQGRKIAKF